MFKNVTYRKIDQVRYTTSTVLIRQYMGQDDEDQWWTWKANVLIDDFTQIPMVGDRYEMERLNDPPQTD